MFLTECKTENFDVTTRDRTDWEISAQKLRNMYLSPHLDDIKNPEEKNNRY